MGLTLSAWLNGPTPDRVPSSSSAFPLLAVPTSSRLALALSSSAISPGDGRSHWSSHHRSPHFQLSPCMQEVTRLPVELSSDGVRAEVGVDKGLHVWEINWSREHRGSHAVIGISKRDCPLQDSGYKVLVGGDSLSWGWEVKTNQLWHDGKLLAYYPCEKRRLNSLQSKETETPFLIPERVQLVLDADAGTLGFAVDGSFLGVAFKDLPSGVELFPAVSSVRGGARIKLRYLNGTTRSPPPLMALCGLSIRQNLGQQRQSQVNKLPLPPLLHHYLLSYF